MYVLRIYCVCNVYRYQFVSKHLSPDRDIFLMISHLLLVVVRLTFTGVVFGGYYFLHVTVVR